MRTLALITLLALPTWAKPNYALKILNLAVAQQAMGDSSNLIQDGQVMKDIDATRPFCMVHGPNARLDASALYKVTKIDFENSGSFGNVDLMVQSQLASAPATFMIMCVTEDDPTIEQARAALAGVYEIIQN